MHHIPNKHLYALKAPKVFRDINTILNRWYFSRRKEKLKEFYELKRDYLHKLESYEFTRLALNRLDYRQKGIYFELLEMRREMKRRHLPCSRENLQLQNLKILLNSKDAGQEKIRDFFDWLVISMRNNQISQGRSNAYLRRSQAVGQSIGIHT